MYPGNCYHLVAITLEDSSIPITLEELQPTISAATQCAMSREWSIILCIAWSSVMSQTNKLLPPGMAASSAVFNLKQHSHCEIRLYKQKVNFKSLSQKLC